MPLGQLSKAQIQSGFAVLVKLKAALESGEKNRDKLEKLSNQFYTAIPHAVGRTRLPILRDEEIVQQKMDMLAVLGDIEIALNLTKGQTSHEERVGDTIEKDNILDQRYDSLHCDLTYVEPDTEEFALVQKYATQTQGVRKPKITGLWRVDREGSTQRFAEHDKLGNRKLLWHGTNIAVVAAILNSGLRIMTHSGGRVGRGIYFASENGKSSSYVGCSGDTGVMFLGEAVLGKEHWIHIDDPSLRCAPPGYESIIAKGQYEPDPKDDVEIELDGHTVVVPLGKPISQPPWKHSRFINSEYLVYKESQAKLRYAMTMTFSR